MKKNVLQIILTIGLISACGTQATNAPASQPTDEPATASPAFTDTPASTATAPSTDSIQSTNTTAAQQSAPISFANDILPLFQNRCKNCHGGNKTEEGLNLLSYANVMKGSDNGLVIVAGDANKSLLVELLLNQKMPKRGPKWTPDQVQIIIDWINQGALDN